MGGFTLVVIFNLFWVVEFGWEKYKAAYVFSESGYLAVFLYFYTAFGVGVLIYDLCE